MDSNDGDDTDIDSAGGLGSGMVMDAPKARAMRPIKISNHDLLDDEYINLRKDLVQNDQFVLLPKGAWQQLHEWYGGGPSIERYVICTDKEMRMTILKFTLDKLNYDYQEEERLMKEAMKKKKSKQKDKKDKNKKDKEDESESETNDNNDKKTTTKGEFDPDKFMKQYKAFLLCVLHYNHQCSLRPLLSLTCICFPFL